MDSHKESDSIDHRENHGCESEASNNRKGISKQRGQGECDENVYTPMSHENELSFYPHNGSREKSSNVSPNNDLGKSSNRIVGRNLESHNANSSQCVNSTVTCINEVNPISVSETDTSGDNNLEFNQDKKACQKHKVCQETVSFPHSSNLHVPSTSGASSSKIIGTLGEVSGIRESRKRPSSLKLNKSNLGVEDSSSDTGNDDYSLGSEDGCIYTYRGGEHLADLPSSFFSLDMGLPLDNHLPIPPPYVAAPQAGVNVRDANSRASSPDMDFLEMDFDPGPSCEVDTEDASTSDTDLDGANMPEENEPVIRGTSPEYLPPQVQQIPVAVPSSSAHEEPYNNVPSTSLVEIKQEAPENQKGVEAFGPYITHINVRGEHLLVKRTMAHCHSNHSISHHVSCGDLISPRELNYEEDNTEAPFAYQINQGERPAFDSSNMSSILYHLTMAKKLMTEKTKGDVENQDAASLLPGEQAACTSESICCVEPPRCMVWSEREACERQVTQIGTSACGATAVVNVFIALGLAVNIERINSAVGTRLRANNAPLPRYLLSRAVAGCTAADLVAGLQAASEGLVTARFFPTHPERAMSLSHWLADWISLGAVPILTLNLQVGCEGEIPDAWHHQMVFGVSPNGVYLTNPVECVKETVLWPKLISPSVLLVKTKDILSRFTPNTDLTPLMAVPDRRFHTFNVLGQVVHAVREWRSCGRARHLRLPAAYQPGVTLAALTGSEAHRRLAHAHPPPPHPPLHPPPPHPPHLPHPPHPPP